MLEKTDEELNSLDVLEDEEESFDQERQFEGELCQLLKLDLQVDVEVQAEILNILKTSPFRNRTLSYDRVVTQLLCNSRDCVVDYIKVPYGSVGQIVGTKGGNIILLQQKTETHIVSPSRGMSSIFTVIGKEKNVAMAIGVIQRFITSQKRRRNVSEYVPSKELPLDTKTKLYIKGKLNDVSSQLIDIFEIYPKSTCAPSYINSSHTPNAVLQNYNYCPINWLPDFQDVFQTNEHGARKLRCISTPPQYILSEAASIQKAQKLFQAMKLAEEKENIDIHDDNIKYHSMSKLKKVEIPQDFMKEDLKDTTEVSTKSIFPFCISCHGGDTFKQLIPCNHGPYCQTCADLLLNKQHCTICQNLIYNTAKWNESEKI